MDLVEEHHHRHRLAAVNATEIAAMTCASKEMYNKPTDPRKSVENHRLLMVGAEVALVV